jgi:GT2 family glycosyltransferase
MQISTFFEDIGFQSTSGYLKDALALRDLHDESFVVHGWHVTHVSLEHARQHPAFADFASMDALHRSSRNGPEYTRICYLRWLAYAQVGHDFADLDVINFGFGPAEAFPLRQLGTRGPVMLTRCGAMGVVGVGGYDSVIGAVYEAARLGKRLRVMAEDVNDMTVLQALRPELFASARRGESHHVPNYTEAGWETARLVHFSHHHTPSPRSEAVASEIERRGGTHPGRAPRATATPAACAAATFSIALPVRGQSEFLPASLESIFAQSTAVNLSVMDASDDDRVQHVLAPHRARIHYSRHGADAGQAAAIREGWDHSPGDILGWLCADDCLFPDALAVVERAFREHPDADVVYGDGVFIDRQGGFIRHFPSISGEIGRITRDCCITQPSCFVRRQALDRVGGIRPDLHYIMDWELWTRLYRAGCRFHYVPQPLSASRMHPGTKTTTNSRERLAEIWRHLTRHNSRRSAVRAMAGVCMAPLAYPELGGPQGETLRAVVRQVRAIGASLGRPSRSRGSAYGLETGSNLVRRRCTIPIPCFGDAVPGHLVVTTRGECSLAASLDGVVLPRDAVVPPSESVAPGRRDRRLSRSHLFRLPDPRGEPRRAFRFDLWSTDCRAWSLVVARLSSAAGADAAPIPPTHLLAESSSPC